MRFVAVLLTGVVLTACSNANRYVVDGPNAPPPKPVYQPFVPDMVPVDDFIHAAGSNTVVFDTSSSELSGEARDTLNRQAAWLITHREVQVLIEGHADQRAPIDYNLALGRRRAKAVVDYLVSRGVTRARFIARSFGEGKPIVPEAGDVQINRRAVTVPLDGTEDLGMDAPPVMPKALGDDVRVASDDMEADGMEPAEETPVPTEDVPSPRPVPRG